MKKLPFEEHWGQCESFIRVHSGLVRSGKTKEHSSRPVVTISREEGAGGTAIAAMLAHLLNQRAAQQLDVPPWTIFDRNLVEKVIEEGHLPKTLGGFMPEDVRPRLTSAVEELLGLHPSDWSLVERTTETILNLSLLGHAIIVGRGSCIITSQLAYAINIRLIAPFETRVTRVAEYQGLTREKAAELIERTDRARRRYLRYYFDADIDDPLNYDLVINTGRLTFEAAASVIAKAVSAKSG